MGIAGWSNPPAEKAARSAHQSHLGFYAQHFSCVEINSSFYRSHRHSTYARWRDQTPASFRFSVKMPRSITHEGGLRGVGAEISQFYAEVERLVPKLTVVLVQLPPAAEYNAATARAFFNALPRLPGAALACEPRHSSWFSRRADDALERFGVARVAADPARCAGADIPGGARRFAYYRWHGTPQLYHSTYDDTRLRVFAAQVARVDAAQSWCIFDNTARHAAWDNAAQFAQLFGTSTLLSPAD